MADSKKIQERLTELQDSEEFVDLFSKVVSGGKPGYKTIIEKGTKIKKCSCGKILLGGEKFCPECGSRLA